jgi:hypothetical protein
VSNLQTILTLLGGIQSTDELRKINDAARTRWHQLQHGVAQQTVQSKGLEPRCPVSFMYQGRRQYGTLRTINSKTCTVDMQQGGYMRVPPGMLTREDKLPEVKAQTPDDLMREILDCYCGLSPENLSCDGEASRASIITRKRELDRRLEMAFRKLGRRVSETEAYEWERKNPDPDPLVRRPLIDMPAVS